MLLLKLGPGSSVRSVYLLALYRKSLALVCGSLLGVAREDFLLASELQPQGRLVDDDVGRGLA
eukprot:5455932-Heterocapsa_arctica.AAC.1